MDGTWKSVGLPEKRPCPCKKGTITIQRKEYDAEGDIFNTGVIDGEEREEPYFSKGDCEECKSKNRLWR